MFADQTSNKDANDVVAEYMRRQIRGVVKAPELAERLCPKYPIGTRGLIQADGYYECFNQDNVSLVDISRSPIERVTETGIQTARSHVELDVIVLAMGFKVFTGEINQIDIRSAQGKSPTDDWDRGPRTLFGLMTAGFPNSFTLTGAGSPAVLGNLFT